MLHFARWKTVLHSWRAACRAHPRLAERPASGDAGNPQALQPAPMTLGLDLQGGSNILLEIDRNDLKTRLTDQMSGDIRSTLREKNSKSATAASTASTTACASASASRRTWPRRGEELRKLLQPVDAGLFGATAPVNLFDITETDQQFTFTFNDAGIDGRIASACSPSIENRREARQSRWHRRGDDPAAGQGPHRRPASRPAGQPGGQAPPRPDRQADLPASLRSAIDRRGPEPATRVQVARA